MCPAPGLLPMGAPPVIPAPVRPYAVTLATSTQASPSRSP